MADHVYLLLEVLLAAMKVHPEFIQMPEAVSTWSSLASISDFNIQMRLCAIFAEAKIPKHTQVQP